MTTAAVGAHITPWTDEEFLAIGETPDRIELFDGSLHVTAAPTPLHQYISGGLISALRPAARRAGLFAHEAINLRLQPGRIPIPDLAITEPIDFTELVIDAAAVRLVCEITSPSNATTDRVLKMHYYARAGIPWYLIIDHRTGTLHLHELVDGTYVERAVTEPGQHLHVTDPVEATLSPDELLPPR